MHKQSSFFSLCPKNMFLLAYSPKDQCKCEKHENFTLKLEALGITYTSDIWESLLCNTCENSNCWLGKCSVCHNGAKVVIQKAANETTLYQQWKSVVVEKQEQAEAENSDESSDSSEEEDQEQDVTNKKENVLKRLQVVTWKVCVGEVVDEFQKGFSDISQHVNVKRIQVKEFHRDISDPKKRVVQVDYAMSYQCELQDEIMSGLWHRCSVTLFTVAVNVREIVATALIVSDSKNKDKLSTWTFLYHIYSDLLGASEDDVCTEIIWSDGPSEFKNRYTMKAMSHLSQVYGREWQWKYSATSHGKGVVDGVGGRVKALVRAKVFSKKPKDHLIAQSPEDFSNAAKKVLTKIAVAYVDKEMIAAHNLAYPIAGVPAVNGISQTHMIQVDEKGTVTMWMNSAYKNPFFTKSLFSNPSKTPPCAPEKNQMRGKKFRQNIAKYSDEDHKPTSDPALIQQLENCQKAIDDVHKGKFFCVYYEKKMCWGRLQHVFANDVEDDAEQVSIDFLGYRNNGFWDFPMKREVLTVNVKFVICGPVSPEITDTRGYKFKEDDISVALYNRVKKLFKTL